MLFVTVDYRYCRAVCCDFWTASFDYMITSLEPLFAGVSLWIALKGNQANYGVVTELCDDFISLAALLKSLPIFVSGTGAGAGVLLDF